MCCNGALRMQMGTVDNLTPAERYSYNPTGNITGRSVVGGTQWITRTYYYSDSAHAHAVTELSNGWEFGHDLNGNMTGRVDSGSYTQAFDVENRLVAVTDTQTLSVTRFIYDGDGNRVLTIYPDGSQNAYVGDHYEVEGSTTRSYYYFGSQRVAMRVDDGASEEVYWFHTDHLGSSSLLSTLTGTLVPSTTVRYLPCGEPRVGQVEQLPTDHGFTGQRWGGSVGLYDYGARWYHAGLGRFVSADTIVPDPLSPQSMNRYSYVLGNPLGFVDPSGHGRDEAIAPMPPSYVRLRIHVHGELPQGHAGVAVSGNAILMDNHVVPVGKTPADIQEITVYDSSGAVLYTAEPGAFAMAGDASLGGGSSLLVFQDDFLSNPAPLGDADDLREGDLVREAVWAGAHKEGHQEGLYWTRVVDPSSLTLNPRLVPYDALVVSPDRTVPGDSGSPVYSGGRVVAVNNSGDGNCGPVSHPGLVERTIAQKTRSLRDRPLGMGR